VLGRNDASVAKVSAAGVPAVELFSAGEQVVLAGAGEAVAGLLTVLGKPSDRIGRASPVGRDSPEEVCTDGAKLLSLCELPGNVDLVEFGVPDEVLTDNAKQFTARFGRPQGGRRRARSARSAPTH
jgi:hypothetical protein